VLFNSIEFMLFFPVVTMFYYALPHKYRWALLLTASCVFYMAFIPAYILILAVTITIDYFAGMWIEVSTGIRRKLILLVSILSTCIVLFIFKYYNFFTISTNSIAKFLNIDYSIKTLNIILPIGLSFHTFQSLSYIIEVYFGRYKAEKHFGIYSLYVMFYPQLVAGPIERPQNLLHQFRVEHHFKYESVTNGLKLMAWGLFKKVVIADRLAIFVDNIYSNPRNHDGLALIVATIFFAYQIYCDFSGYSDIAIGSAQVMGFNLSRNFNRPYSSKSISEFWKRWHISLSSWFRDYLYIPLGGKRVSSIRLYINLMLTFLVSGLWHGANWTFVLWGFLNGFYLLFSIWTGKLRDNLSSYIGLSRHANINNVFRVVITFILVCFGWIFFRSNSIADALYVITHLFSGIRYAIDINYITRVLSGCGFDKVNFVLSFILIVILEIIQYKQSNCSIRYWLSQKPAYLRWSLYYAIILSIIFLGVISNSTFIYFQF
jgi:alginate O-acetyltransferase complex protein AlgI